MTYRSLLVIGLVLAVLAPASACSKRNTDGAAPQTAASGATETTSSAPDSDQGAAKPADNQPAANAAANAAAAKPAAQERCSLNDFSSDDPFPLTSEDALDGIKQGMSTAEVEKRLGAPDSKSKPKYEAATGYSRFFWRYPERGMFISFTTDGKDDPGTVSSLAVSAPGTAKTRFGIGVGSTAAEVNAAYQDCISEDENVVDDAIIAGSVYGGVIFSIEDGVVSSVFIGADAE